MAWVDPMAADLKEVGAALKAAGMASIEQRNPAVLGALRKLARILALQRGEISINDLREEAKLPPGTTPLLFSVVFRGEEWIPCGFISATHPQAHRRIVRLYRLRSYTW